MSVSLLPARVIEAMDKRRHAFLWTGEEVCHGGHCKVAWLEVWTPKNLGGSGFFLFRLKTQLFSPNSSLSFTRTLPLPGPACFVADTVTTLTLPFGNILSLVLSLFAPSPKP
jgi:hypothetical protein